MANEHNLISLGQRTESERRKIQRQAGIASGRARRQKAELRQAFQTLLTAEVNNEQMKELLINLGYDPTNEMALALVVLQKALNGDIRAFGQIKEIIDKDDD
ncbi:hypothetical protein ACVRZC_09050 [Streptococcus hyointestinalis]|uniref:Phage protein n=1 Tax=Streptococcus hyointestinalis TaxID=1337 RepID=A0A380KDI8_9STRE|nr:hypothetical protein [Streptococcus hyointestinalis]SUN63011.1 phage protein [Streptococcus hyointestinalis]